MDKQTETVRRQTNWPELHKTVRNAGGLIGSPIDPQTERINASISNASAKVTNQAKKWAFPIQPLDQNDLAEGTNSGDTKWRQHHTGPAEIARERDGEIGSEREEGSVGKIYDPEQPEDDRQADRDQDVQKPKHEAVRELRQNGIDHRARPPRKE
jgi:hypothetical protein